MSSGVHWNSQDQPYSHNLGGWICRSANSYEVNWERKTAIVLGIVCIWSHRTAFPNEPSLWLLILPNKSTGFAPPVQVLVERIVGLHKETSLITSCARPISKFLQIPILQKSYSNLKDKLPELLEVFYLKKKQINLKTYSCFWGRGENKWLKSGSPTWVWKVQVERGFAGSALHPANSDT